MIAAPVALTAAEKSVKSGTMGGGQEPEKITLDVSGMDAFELLANGYSWGQAVWGEAKLIKQDGSETRIVDLKPSMVKVGWGNFTLNKGPHGKPLKVGSREFKHGLFAHADSVVIYQLNKEYKRFEAWVGINQSAAKAGRVVFTVAGAGERLKVEAARLKKEALANSRKMFSRESMSNLRKSFEKSIAAKAGNADRYGRKLQELSVWEKAFEGISKALEDGDETAFEELDKYVSFVRSVYSSRLDAPLLFVRRQPFMAGHIYDDYLPWRPGGGIYIIENPDAPLDKQVVRAVIDPDSPETLGEGVYRDPDISYDGRRIVFAFKGSQAGGTSIFEIGVDGKGLKRLTNPDSDCNYLKPQPGLVGRGHHDITPCYMPDGRIAFTSTRTGGHVMCFSSYIDTLHTMNADGSDIKCISVNNQNEFDPSMMHDGRILYGRWEYVDKTALYMQSLWTVNPDGSGETAFFANNMAKPTALLDARAVPDSRLIVAALTPHNGQAVGAIAMIDPLVGKNSLDAIANFTPKYRKEMDQGLRRGPSDPWPLSEDLVLIANNDQEHGAHGVIELIDRHGYKAVIHRATDISCYAPMLVKPRTKPHVKPSQIRPGMPGMFMVHDIYQGMEGVERGTIKKLRVIESTSRVSGIPPGGRWWNQAFLVSWQGSYDVKKFYGVIPVEEDGSAFFEAPVGKALYFQALDRDGRMVQSQRTFIQAVSGITRSCMGCHIKEDNAAPVNTGKLPQALKKPASKLQPESWGMGFVDYPTMVQPVLDKHCVSCHGGEKGIKGGIDLTGGWTYAFSISYETLLKNTLVGFLNCNNGSVRTSEILDPMTHGSGAAPLTDLLLKEHRDKIKNLSKSELDLLLVWMDGNCNYYGTWDYSPHAVCRVGPRTRDMLLAEMDKTGCLKCHQKDIGNDWINLKTPERSRVLRAPLAKANRGLGLAWCRERKAQPVDMPLVQRQQPPDVFRPRKKAKRNEEGKTVVLFQDTTNASYKAMLKVITQARNTALKTPRVDMPGAEIVKGKCRELTPITPPDFTAKNTTKRGM